MSGTRPARAYRRRRVRAGLRTRVAGAYLALPGHNPPNAGPRLVSGAVPRGPLDFNLAKAGGPGPAGVNSVGGVTVVSPPHRSDRDAAFLDNFWFLGKATPRTKLLLPKE